MNLIINQNSRRTFPRLLIILNRFVIGGQAVDTLPLAFYLQPDFEILIVYGEKEKDEVAPAGLLEQYPGLTLKKVKFLKRSFNPLYDFAACVQLLFIIKTFSPTIVHTHGAKPGLLGRFAAWISAVPVTVHTFHGHLFHSYFNKFLSRLILALERLLARITSGFITLSSAQYDELVTVFKVFPADKGRIIPLGFEFIENVGELQRRNFRRKFNLTEQDVAIGIVGRIVPVKNHLFFADVVRNILNMNAGNAPAFFIIGDGISKGEIEKHFADNNLVYSHDLITHDTRIVFTSWILDIPEVMCGLDIVVLTSLNEGTPLALIEAQAFGKPIIATNVGGVRDTLVNGVTGFLIEKDDKAGFSEKLLLLINNAAKRREMGKIGKQFVQEHFSKQKEIESIKEFYFSLLTLKGKMA